MKILLATPLEKPIGGIVIWAQHIMRYYNNLQKKQCEIDVLQMDRPNFTKTNSVFKRVYLGLIDYFKFYKDENNMLNVCQYDIFHLVSSASISIFKDYLMLRAAKKKGVKTILHFHFGRIPQLSVIKNWEWKMICKVVALSDTTIVLDKATLNALKKVGFNNVVVLANPIAPQVNSIIEKNKEIEREPRTLLFVGHGLYTKGVNELVEACKEIPNIKVRMVGRITDVVKHELQEKIAYKDWLEIVGECPYEKTISEMLSCDVFVLPTYTEGFPNVILESMACGCAIVTTPVGAIPEMLAEEKGKQYGILVAPKNVNELKDGIERMLNNEMFKLECRKNVQERVNAKYNIDTVWKQMVLIWSSTINENKSYNRQK